METICPKVCSKSRLKSAKSLLLADVRRCLTSLIWRRKLRPYLSSTLQGSNIITRYRGPGCENSNIAVNNGEYRSDFSPVIINISKIGLLNTNFDLRFLAFYLSKMLHFRNLSSG